MPRAAHAWGRPVVFLSARKNPRRDLYLSTVGLAGSDSIQPHRYGCTGGVFYCATECGLAGRFIAPCRHPSGRRPKFVDVFPDGDERDFLGIPRAAMYGGVPSWPTANYTCRRRSAWGQSVKHPNHKSLGVGDRVAITVGALRDLRAVVLAVGPQGQLTLRPDGWQAGVVMRISDQHVLPEPAPASDNPRQL